MRWTPLVVVIASACVMHQPRVADTRESTVIDPLGAYEEAPGPSDRLEKDGLAETVAQGIDTWFEGHGSRRLHVQLDRPMVRPGESVWFKTWSVATRAFETIDEEAMITYELRNPKGDVTETKKLLQKGGTATNDFEIPSDAAGGKWTLRAEAITGEVHERDFIVSTYEAPRIRKELTFLREAYGAGETVEALIELEHATNGVMANRTVKAMLQVAGETVFEDSLSTDATGAVLVSAALPAELASSDGLLTLLIEDGGVTESISRSVPIVLADVQLAFFPEGGDLVEGLPGRVYFEGLDQHGEPADLEGIIEDDTGTRVDSFRSVKDGMGRFAFTPQQGRKYHARITKPAGIAGTYALPDALPWGCTLRHFDDIVSRTEATRVAVRCSEAQEVVVSGVLRETVVDTAAVSAGPILDTIVYLDPNETLADQQGAMRVTVFDWELQPVAERLVYRNPGKDLRIEVTADEETYGPRDKVTLKVKTTSPSGKPVPAEIALSVVDDAVLSLADDEKGHMLSRLYLEPDLIDPPEDPGWYFDPEEGEAARGLDLVMGTKGWRHFEWEPVWDTDQEPVEPIVLVPPAPVPPPQPIWEEDLMMLAGMGYVGGVDDIADMGGMRGMGGMLGGDIDFDGGLDRAMVVEKARPVRRQQQKVPMARPMQRNEAPMAPMAAAAPMPAAPMPVARPVEAPPADPAPRARAKPRPPPQHAKKDLEMGGERRDLAEAQHALGRQARAPMADAEPPWGLADQAAARDWNAPRWAPVRVFPAPNYKAGFNGVRSDFRDTVHWEPTVVTDKSGTAKVDFYLSDAVTTFRVTAEGLGGGYAGHGESTLTSMLPVSISAKLPVAVSTTDRLLLPLTVSSTRKNPLGVTVRHTIDSPLVTVENSEAGQLDIDAMGAATHWLPMTFGHGRETVKLRFEAEGGGLSDVLERELQVVPAGFPRDWSESGELTRVAKHSFELGEVVPNSLTARVTWHPSTVASLMEGMEGLIRTPGGCFEQTSSTNWPNVAILNYLEAHEGDPRLKLQSSQALGAGYTKLTGYQVSAGGFETWGSGPGKEALSAFGLLQFSDMAKVFKVAPSVLDRNVAYLLSVRDGQGGYRKTGESAHGYGSAPKEVLDGFITMALVKTGHASQIPAEIDAQAKIAKTTKDPYVLAMAARAMGGASHPETAAALKRLAAMQSPDGSFQGAKSSITRSYEANLVVESTALAALALMESGGYRHAADKSAKWLVDNRQGPGTWGATQATALALGALSTHAQVNTAPRISGTLLVEVNGETVDTLDYKAYQKAALEIGDWAHALRPGENTIVLRQKSGQPMPYTIEVNWAAETPDSAPDAELGVTTTLDRNEARMGETVRLTTTVHNRTDRIQPSPIARVGIPAGLEPQIWQLEELQERGAIAFFETRPREVTLYWDGIHTDEEHTVNLDLVAAIPGEFTAPATSAWPYYDDDDKAWEQGLTVSIGRASGATK